MDSILFTLDQLDVNCLSLHFPPCSAGVLEKPLEKKAGRNYGPPGTKKLIYFVDDMNMPMVSTYIGVLTYLFEKYTCVLTLVINPCSTITYCVKLC